MNLDRVVKPASVAVVGVSGTKLDSAANVVYKKLKNQYAVRVYGVNPRGGEVQGDKLYESISAISEAVDLAVISVKADFVLDVIAECIQKDVGGAALISAGFSEIGNTALQCKLVDMAVEAQFPVIGPNCLGVYSPGNVDTFFIPPERMFQPTPGNVAVISQSGAFLVDLMVKFANAHIGVSHAVSIGNKAVIREIDLLKYLEKDTRTSVIVFYIEGFDEGEGREFVSLAKQCKKPVLVFKSGKSEAGSKALISHTASMAGNYQIASTAFEQYGIIEVKSEYELVTFCKALSMYRKPIDGNVGIITVSGGHGAIATDMAIARGLNVPRVPLEDQERIKSQLNPGIQNIATLNNPMDLTASSFENDFITVYNELSNLSTFDSFLLLILPYSANVEATIGAHISNPTMKRVKPLVAYTPYVEKYRMMIEGFESNSVPVADSIEGAVMMIDALKKLKR